MSRLGTATRYAVIDDLLPDEIAQDIAAAFPRDDTHFSLRNSFRERKRTSTRFDDLPAILKEITFAFQMPDVSGPIAHATGIHGMAGDPTLYAGGLSIMRKGDFLNPHIDNSHEATRTRYRRVNLLYYVSPDWPEDAGGNLELWDAGVSRPVTIPSRFNRLVLMETGPATWHSVSEVAIDRPRLCVSNYYFSAASPTGAEYRHVTSFTGRPEQSVRRLVGPLDNAARQFARSVGARRNSDKGFVPAHRQATM